MTPWRGWASRFPIRRGSRAASRNCSLRKRLREHALPDERNCATLTALLTGRRYLSIRFAYQNPALIAGAFAAIEGERNSKHALDD